MKQGNLIPENPFEDWEVVTEYHTDGLPTRQEIKSVLVGSGKMLVLSALLFGLYQGIEPVLSDLAQDTKVVNAPNLPREDNVYFTDEYGRKLQESMNDAISEMSGYGNWRSRTQAQIDRLRLARSRVLCYGVKDGTIKGEDEDLHVVRAVCESVQQITTATLLRDPDPFYDLRNFEDYIRGFDVTYFDRDSTSQRLWGRVYDMLYSDKKAPNITIYR